MPSRALPTSSARARVGAHVHVRARAHAHVQPATDFFGRPLATPAKKKNADGIYLFIIIIFIIIFFIWYLFLNELLVYSIGLVLVECY